MAPNSPSVLADAAYQLPDRPGFRFRGVSYEGFNDRPELPTHVRKQIARWAVQQRVPSFDQLLLAEEPRPETIKDDSLYAHLERERELLGNKEFQAILGLLSDDERSRVLRPHNILKRDLAWPLTTSDAAKVLRSVTANQLRDWDNADLIKPVRYGQGDYRGYFRSHLVLALLLAKSLHAKWSIVGIKHWAGIDPIDPRDPAEGFKGLITLQHNWGNGSGLDVLQTSFIGERSDVVDTPEDVVRGDQLAKR